MTEGIKTYHIYALCNPLTNRFYYVGCTVNPKKRLSAHIATDQPQHCSEKREIEAAIAGADLKPEMHILDSVRATAKYRRTVLDIEKFWSLKLLAQGHDIVGLNTRTWFTKLYAPTDDYDYVISRYKREAEYFSLHPDALYLPQVEAM